MTRRKPVESVELKVNGKRRPKWIPLGLPERGNKREAESLLSHLIVEYGVPMKQIQI